MRTTDHSARRRRPRSPKAAVAKIVLSGASTGAALGMVGVMAMAEAPSPELQQTPPSDLGASATPTTAPTSTLPPRRVIRYVYRQVIVPDGATLPRSAGTTSYITRSAPAPVAAPAARRSAVTTTTTKGS